LENQPTIVVIIPALNEEDSIGKVVNEIPKDNVLAILVCNNGSSDQTEEVAKKAGAIVLNEPKPGYGWACLKGMDYVSKMEIKPDIIVFIDGDYSDYPAELTNVVAPIIHQQIDLVIGFTRFGGKRKRFNDLSAAFW
jgi:glycosyltransferase involved in cell wall biosynthesis